MPISISCHKQKRIPLLQKILSMNSHGAALRPTTAREVPNHLVAKRGSIPTESIGEKWVYIFTKRHKAKIDGLQMKSGVSGPRITSN